MESVLPTVLIEMLARPTAFQLSISEMSQQFTIEPDEIDDLPAYDASSSTAPLPHSATPQPEAFGRINTIAGEVVSDRRYTGGDTLDEPVSTTIV